MLTDHYHGMPTADHNTQTRRVGFGSPRARTLGYAVAGCPTSCETVLPQLETFLSLIIITLVNTEDHEPLMRLIVDEVIILKLFLTHLCTIRAVIFQALYNGTPSPPSLEDILSRSFLKFVLTKNGSPPPVLRF
jgi:hypothetical protein